MLAACLPDVPVLVRLDTRTVRHPLGNGTRPQPVTDRTKRSCSLRECWVAAFFLGLEASGVDEPVRAKGPSVRLGIAVIVAGFVVGVLPAIKLIPEVIRAFSSPATVTPGVVHVDLRSGRYVIFELTGHRTDVGGGGINFNYTRNNAPSIGPEAVIVTASTTGRRISVKAMSSNETITRGSQIFTGVVEFNVSDRGAYDVHVNSPRPSRVIVARSIADTFTRFLGWIVLAALAWLTVVSGIALLIIGAVRRRRQRTPGPPRGYSGIWPPPS